MLNYKITHRVFVGTQFSQRTIENPRKVRRLFFTCHTGWGDVWMSGVVSAGTECIIVFTYSNGLGCCFCPWYWYVLCRIVRFSVGAKSCPLCIRNYPETDAAIDEDLWRANHPSKNFVFCKSVVNFQTKWIQIKPRSQAHQVCTYNIFQLYLVSVCLLHAVCNCVLNRTQLSKLCLRFKMCNNI